MPGKAPVPAPSPRAFVELAQAREQTVIRVAGLEDSRRLLAKHDENYMPPEAADAIKKAEAAKAAAAQQGTGSSAEHPAAK